MNEKSGTFELMEPPSPEALVPDSPIEPWMIATAVLLVCMLALFLLRKKKPVPFDPLAIRRASYAEAAAALAAIGNVPPREAAVQGSLILRKYLSVATADPALFETHEETLLRHNALKEFSEATRQAAGQGFSRLAALKYAQDQPAVAAVDVIADSRALLETLHHGFQP